jgi:hypothetical protein
MGEIINVEYLRKGKIHTASFKLNRRSDAFLSSEEQYDNYQDILSMVELFLVHLLRI